MFRVATLLRVLLCGQPAALGWAFIPSLLPLPPPTSTFRGQSTVCTRLDSTTDENIPSASKIDIVLFGVGDLRTSDHKGLHDALRSGNRILPLVVLDEEDTLPNLPQSRTQTLNAASILSSAISSLGERLLEIDDELHLNVKFANGGLKEGLMDVLTEVIKLQGIDPIDGVTLHVCDLGDADDGMGYGPYAHLKNENLNLSEGIDVSLKSWTCHLREEPWSDLDRDAGVLPDKHPDYDLRYNLKAGVAATVPVAVANPRQGTVQSVSLPSLSLPSDKSGFSKQVLSSLCSALKIDLADISTKTRLENERDTGLYGTHWGGLDAGVLSEAEVLSGLDTYASLEEEDSQLLKSDWWKSRRLVRNGQSLEHAALEWMMSEFSNYRDEYGGHHQFAEVDTGNLIRGEFMTRYLAAPLLYGVVSSRQLWHAADVEDTPLAKFLPFLRNEGALRSLAEGREWHKLFAAKNIRSALAEGIKCGDAKPGDMSFSYWRWHGFLCRYCKTMLNDKRGAKKEGIVLVHGFGASGAQWSKATKELSSRCTTASVAAAPDLIGFGQSEKPPLTYTQYLWESYTSSFAREVCLSPLKLAMDTFVVGGNSIGGYTAMGMAADDTIPIDEFVHDVGEDGKDWKRSMVSASGAPGTGRCKGLVLMNSAGQLYKREEVEKILEKGNVATMASVTASDQLPKCAPPPRSVASAFGKGLLAYLRPRIPSICTNLYPTNPAAVDDVLTKNILRDSLDPGAINVMISGSKLPPPRTANELLGADFGSSKSNPDIASGATNFIGAMPVAEGMFDGPCLVAQGILDPLNDARGRADMLENLRSGVDVMRIEAGHCPHDELPDEIADAISVWMGRTFGEIDSLDKADTAAGTGTFSTA